MEEGLLTEFAPPERATQEELERQISALSATPHLCNHFDAVPSVVLILNRYRQIVFANRTAVTAFELKDRADVYGLRPGEALGCIHADCNEAGCGTSSFCRECGAVRSILAGLGGEQSVEECRVSARNGTVTYDFRVFSSPYEDKGERYNVFVLNDISHEKRRQVLERVFFHDVANTLTLLSAYAQLMPGDSVQEEKELTEKLDAAVGLLTREVEAQRCLLQAEDGDLFMVTGTVRAGALLKDMASLYLHHKCARDKHIIVEDGAQDVKFVSDKTLLARILENMLRNALEASPRGETVRAGCKALDDGRIRFWVANNQYMPIEAQHQIFNRSFTTKGAGRGVGTYSMKLLGEQFLKGEIDFTSSEESGTIFTATFPPAV